LEAFPKQDQNPFQGFQNHIHTVFPKQQHNRPLYNGRNIFNSNIVSDFSSFPIGNPKQLQHNNPPAFQKSQRSIYGSKNPFSDPIIQGPDIWKQLQQNNLPEGPQPNIFPPILKGPDVWKQLQQSNLPKKW
jgi:hypothetical protein